MELSQARLDAFAAIFPMNARPIQPLNGREFEFVTALPATGMDVVVLNRRRSTTQAN